MGGGEAEGHLSSFGGLIAHGNSSDSVGTIGGEGCLRREASKVDSCCGESGAQSVKSGSAS
jgi:hypothetical protein